jgi:hypothetical protein
MKKRTPAVMLTKMSRLVAKTTKTGLAVTTMKPRLPKMKRALLELRRKKAHFRFRFRFRSRIRKSTLTAKIG